MSDWRDRIKPAGEQPAVDPPPADDWRARIRPAEPTPTLDVGSTPVGGGAAPTAREAAYINLAGARVPVGGKAEDTSELGVLGKLGRAVGEGVASAAAPFAMDKDFYHRQREWYELIPQALANFATGRGLATGAGAVLGLVSPIPGGAAGGAMLGNVLYGLYAGVGTEVSRSKAEDKDFSPLRAAANAALEINPLVKAASKSTAALRVAGQVAGGAATEYSYTGSPVGAAIAGAAGLILAPFAYRGIRPEQLPTAGTQKAVNDLLQSDMGIDLTMKAAKRVEAMAPEAKVFRAQDATQDFVEYATAKEGAAAAKEWAQIGGKLGQKELDEIKSGYLHGRAMLDEAAEVAQKLSDEVAEGQLETVKTMAHLKGAEYVAAATDRKLGWDLEGTFYRMSKGIDRFNTMAAGYVREVNELSRATKKLGVSREDIGRYMAGQPVSRDVMAKLERPDVFTRKWTDTLGNDQVSKLSLADGWRDVYDRVHEQIRRAGFDAGHIDNYFTIKQLDGPELVMAVRKQLSQLQADALKAGAKNPWGLKTDAVVEFKQFAAGRLGKRYEDLTDQELNTLASAVLNPAKTNVGYSVGAAFGRSQNVMPDWARDYDVGRVALRYINSNLKATQLSDVFRELQTKAAAARTLGLTNTAKYIDTYAANLSGQLPEKGPRAFWTAKKAGAKLWGLEQEAAGNAKLGKAAQALPDFVEFLNNNVYPAYLGANPRAAIRNMTQAWFQTAPELGGALGGAWGQLLVTRAAIQTAGRLRTKGWRTYRAELMQRGLLGGDVTKAELATDQAITGAVARRVRQINELSMWAYSKTDDVNRMITANAAELWHAAVLKGDKSALTALERLPAGFKTQLRQAGGVQSPQAADIMADYLIGRTQFRYGQATLNEFGREYGSAFSMFTKWPVMVISDVADTFQRNANKGTLKGSWAASQRLGTRYMAPLLALHGIQKLWGQLGDEDDKGVPRGVGRWLLGDDLRSMSPVMSIPMVDFLNSPMLEFGRDVLSGSADEKKRATLLRRSVKTYVPGVSQVINEIDRFQQAFEPGTASPSKELINKIPTLGEDD